MVNLSSYEESKSRRESLFQQHAHFTLAIHLSPERSHPEFVLGTQRRRRLSLTGTHRARRGVEDLEVETYIDGGGEFLVIRRLDDPGGLELQRRDPLVERVETQAGGGRDRGGGRRSREGGEFGEVGSGGFEDLRLGVLDQGLESEGESGGDRVKEGNHVDSGEVGRGRVDGSQVERVVRAHVVVFDLNHRVAGLTSELQEREGHREQDRQRTGAAMSPPPLHLPLT